MYTLLIAEDESIMREGLCQTIPWEAWGFSVIGSVEDGNKALAMIEREVPSLVITDIRMPGMDGLEMLEVIRKRFPDTRVILLSGYEDFEYVRQGMRLGASGYVLKLNLLTELQQAVLQVKEQLDQEGSVKSLQQENDRLNREIRLRETVRTILLGNFSGESEISLEAFSNRDISYFMPIVIYVNNYFAQIRDTNPQAIGDRIAKLEGAATALLSEFNLCFSVVRIKENEWVAVYFSDKPLGEVAQLIKTKLLELSGETELSLSMAIGKPCAALGQLYESYQQARMASLVHLPNEKIQISMSQDFVEVPIPPALDEIEPRILFALEMGDRENVASYTSEWFEEWRKLPVIHVMKLQERILQFLGKAIPRIKELFDIENDTTSSLVDVVHYEDTDALEGWAKARMEQLLRMVNAVQESETESRISRIIIYMKANIHEKITLKQMAAFVYLNSSYLSVVFKEHTGKSFTDFVIELKMNKAAAYLGEGLKVKQAAEKVGYEDPKHFRKMFHKFIGTNPGEYR